MKAYSLLILLIARAIAQTAGGVPACGESCVVDNLLGGSVFGCNNGDAACICSNKAFLTTISCCIAKVCDQADKNATIIYVEQICYTAQVTSLTPASTCPSSTSSASASSTSTAQTAVSSCPAGWTLCTETCVHTPNDRLNCGACGNVCSNPNGGGVATCAAGICGPSSRSSSLESASFTIPSGPPGSTSTTPPTSSLATTPPTTSSNGLSTSAKAGIAIGVTGVIFIILLALFFLLRRRRIRGHGNSKDALPPPYLGKQELPANEKPIPIVQSKELATQAVKHEMETSPTVAELQSPVPDRDQVPQEAFNQTYQPDYGLDGEKPIPMVQRKELAALANTHELSSTAISPVTERKKLDAKADDHELPVDTTPTTVELQNRSWDGDQDGVSQQTFGQPYQPNELESYPVAAELQGPEVAEPPPKQTFSQPFKSLSIDPYGESYNQSAESGSGAADVPQELESYRASIQTLLSDTGVSTRGSSKMDELRARRDKIRVEKERLLKLHELDELEASVRREMLEEQRKARVNVSP